MTVDEFTTRFPEWLQVAEDAPEIIERALTDAAQFVDAAVWGDRYDAGLAYKAADLLAGQPFGENARLKGSDKTTYGIRFEQMRTALPIRFLLV